MNLTGLSLPDVDRKLFRVPDNSRFSRMKPSSYYERIVDVMEELVKFTLLTRDHKDHLMNPYPERVESAEALSKRVDQRSL